MAYKAGEIIKATDLGKTLTNGNVEIANYNVFSITVKAKGNRFTFLFIRNNNKQFNATAPDGGTWSGSTPICQYTFQITLSGNTFSAVCYYLSQTSTTSCSIDQIRGVM